MKYLLLALCCVGCASGESTPFTLDAITDAALPPADAAPDTKNSCGIYTDPSGVTHDYGTCPEGKVCGDNGQANLCGNTCLPRYNPISCNDMLSAYGFAPDQLLEYSLYCRTDPPIDQYNCVIWQKGVGQTQDINHPCVDCDPIYCCLPPYLQEGDAGLIPASDASVQVTEPVVKAIQTKMIGFAIQRE